MSPNQPREFDAVLSNSLPPKKGAVLGGLAGVKSRLNSPILEVRISALASALNYGDAGIDLIITSLQDVEIVQRYAIQILLHKGGAKGKQALLDYDPKLFFTTLQHWDIQNYNPQLSITHTAYAINLNSIQANKPEKFDLTQLQSFLQSNQTTQIEALSCKMWDDYWQHDTQYKDFENVLCGASNKLPNLKALFNRRQDVSTQRLAPILSGELFPSLKYLGLKSSDYSDNIAFSIVNSPLLQRLAVLDLSQGTLTDRGAEILLKCPAINQLHTLNVSMNKLSARMVQKLSRLHCRVIAQPQDNGERQQFI
jgi:hypothetical protein